MKEGKKESSLTAMTSNLLAMASNLDLIALASDPIEKGKGLKIENKCQVPGPSAVRQR